LNFLIKNPFFDLELSELKTVLNAILDMLSLNDVFELNELSADIMNNLDTSHDQKVSKGL
jgi:hypothetical protein